MQLKDILKEYRTRNKLSMDELSRKSGLSKAYISMLESGVNPQTKKEISPTIEALTKIAYSMNISFNELINNLDDTIVELPPVTQDTKFNTDLIQLPVYAPLCCGEGMFVDEEIIDYVVVPSDWINKRKEYFCQFASGDSMINAGIKDADILIFEKASIVDSGTIGCFCVDENIATCKKFMVNEMSEIYLMPANENHMPIKIDHMNEHFRTVGKLAFVVSDRRGK